MLVACDLLTERLVNKAFTHPSLLNITPSHLENIWVVVSAQRRHLKINNPPCVTALCTASSRANTSVCTVCLYCLFIVQSRILFVSLFSKTKFSLICRRTLGSFFSKIQTSLVFAQHVHLCLYARMCDKSLFGSTPQDGRCQTESEDIYMSNNSGVAVYNFPARLCPLRNEAYDFVDGG